LPEGIWEDNRNPNKDTQVFQSRFKLGNCIRSITT